MQKFLRAARLAAIACSLLLAGAAHAAGWLIAAPSESVRAGEAFALEVVRPDAATPWPETLRVRLLRPDGVEEFVELHGEVIYADGTRRSYRGRLPAATGVLRADLAGLPSNRLALIADAPGEDAIARMELPAAAAPHFNGEAGDEEPALSANEPMYIVAGARDGLDARFQLSFKYRLFDARSLPARLGPALGHLHVGYTQTSLWDLHSDSKPFRDTSYRPSLFWEGRVSDGSGGRPDFLRGGYEHESNGRDGERSRSIDTLFVQPAWRKEFADGRSLLFAPKFYSYLERDDNSDIAKYRGYADWNLRYGDEDGWVLATRLRRGTAGHGSAQLDLSYPLREPLFAQARGFVHVQLFSGYGETLLDYNVKRDPQLRIGFSVVR